MTACHTEDRKARSSCGVRRSSSRQRPVRVDPEAHLPPPCSTPADMTRYGRCGVLLYIKPAACAPPYRICRSSRPPRHLGLQAPAAIQAAQAVSRGRCLDQAACRHRRVSGRRLDERWLGGCDLRVICALCCDPCACACSIHTSDHVVRDQPRGQIGYRAPVAAAFQQRLQAEPSALHSVGRHADSIRWFILWSGSEPPPELHNLAHDSPLPCRAGLPSELLGRILEVAADQMSLPPTALLAMRFTCRCAVGLNTWPWILACLQWPSSSASLPHRLMESLCEPGSCDGSILRHGKAAQRRLSADGLVVAGVNAVCLPQGLVPRAQRGSEATDGAARVGQGPQLHRRPVPTAGEGTLLRM